MHSGVGAFLVGSAIYIVLAALVLAAVYFSIIQVGYARFNLNLVDHHGPSFDVLFAYFSYWKTMAAVLYAVQFYWPGYPQFTDTRNRCIVAAPLLNRLQQRRSIEKSPERSILEKSLLTFSAHCPDYPQKHLGMIGIIFVFGVEITPLHL